MYKRGPLVRIFRERVSQTSSIKLFPLERGLLLPSCFEREVERLRERERERPERYPHGDDLCEIQIRFGIQYFPGRWLEKRKGELQGMARGTILQRVAVV